VPGGQWEWGVFSVVGGKFGRIFDHFRVGFNVCCVGGWFLFLSLLVYYGKLDVECWRYNCIVLFLILVVSNFFCCLRSEVIGFCRVLWFVVEFLVVFVVGGLGVFTEGG
jgi:hypothetical protein